MLSASEIHGLSEWLKAGEAFAEEMLSSLTDDQLAESISWFKVAASMPTEQSKLAIAKGLHHLVAQSPTVLGHAFVLMYAREYLRRINNKTENE